MAKPEARRRKTGKASAAVVDCEVGVNNTEGQTEVAPPSVQAVAPSGPKEGRRRTRKKRSAGVELLSVVKGRQGVDVVSQMDSPSLAAQVKECVPDVTKEEKSAMRGVADEKANGGDEEIVNKTVKNVNGKRRAQSTDKTSPKKAKTISEGFRVFVSNLNNTKKYNQVRDSLARVLLKQSLLVQDITLDPSRKYAYVDLATEMDFTKALTLNGMKVLEMPIKVRKPRIKEDEVKTIAASEAKKAKNARSVFLKNVPCNATKKDILKVFDKAVGVRFPGRTILPREGFAIVEFETEAIAEQVLNTKEETKIQDNVLILEYVKERTDENSKPSPVKAEVQSLKSTVHSNTLFVNNVPFKIKKNEMKNIFEKAVTITLSKVVGATNRFAFVKFKTVEDAKEAMEISQSKKISGRTLRVQFCNAKTMSAHGKVLANSLIVKGLSEETDEDTLKRAFEGSTSARIIADKKTGVSRGFGFVDFERDEDCSAAMENMKDCSIGGRRVTLVCARSRDNKGPTDPEAQPEQQECGAKGGGSKRKRGGRRGPKLSQDGAKKGQVEG